MVEDAASIAVGAAVGHPVCWTGAHNLLGCSGADASYGDIVCEGGRRGDRSHNLHLLPANATLKDVELELVQSSDGRWRLHQALQPLLHAFDFILIDTPPTLGFLTQAPLVASTELLIPVDVGYFAFEGLRQLLDAIARLRQEVPLTLETPHILLTKFDARTTLSAHVRALLRENYGAAALHTVIRVMSLWPGHRWPARVFLRTIAPPQGPRIISTWWRSYSGTVEPWSPAAP